MKKDRLIIAAYLLTSLGLFTLAIDMWICGGEPFCRQSNSLSARIAKAAITITMPESSDHTTLWLGLTEEGNEQNFTINLTGQNSSIPFPFVPGDGDSGGDSGSDGH